MGAGISRDDAGGASGLASFGAAGELGIELIATVRMGVSLIEVREPTPGTADVFAPWVAAKAEGGTRVQTFCPRALVGSVSLQGRPRS